MAKSVFVMVYGFDSAERHAIRSLLALSRDRATVYLPWREGAARRPSIILVDGSSEGARRGYAEAMATHPEMLPVWVISSDVDHQHTPPNVLEVLNRPIDWQRLVGAMDHLFDVHGSDSAAVDLDLDRMESADTTPDVLESKERILLVDADRDTRLFIRAALAARGFCELDDVASVIEAQSLLRFQHYVVAMINVGDAGAQAWDLVSMARNRMATPFVIASNRGPLIRLRAWAAGAKGVLAPPFDVQDVETVLMRASR